MSLPDFLLLGAPKCGTTALHVALPTIHSCSCRPSRSRSTSTPTARRRPGAGRATPATYAGYVWRREDYEAAVRRRPARARSCGESTTLYLATRRRTAGSRRRVPDARLVAVLRDPVDRAHSNWAHLRSAGLEPEGDFLRACALEHQRAEAGWGSFWRYLGWAVRRAARAPVPVLPREQVLVLLYRDLRERPVETLDRCAGFLGVQTGLLTRLSAENVTAHVEPSRLNDALHQASRVVPPQVRTLLARLLQREQRRRPALTIDERALLLPYFAEDVTLLEQVTGRSFAHWRDPANSLTRRTLEVDRPFGTAFSSIDRPVA